MAATNIFHQNYEEDFLYVFRFAGGIPTYPWRLVFNTYAGHRKSLASFVASFDGETFANCRVITGTEDTILVQFDNHHLTPGDLCFSLSRWTPNDLFEDGDQRKVLPQHTGWELWDGPTDPEPSVTTVILEQMLKGDSAYEVFKRYYPDSELSEQEYAEGPVIAAANADAARGRIEQTEVGIKLSEEQRQYSEQIRVTSESGRIESEQVRCQQELHRREAEQTRIASEQTRETSEEGRVGAELIRAESERQRISDESSRKQAESVRLTAESERVSAEKKRGTDTASAIKSAKEAAQAASDQSTRVKALADHPPKIVDVKGLKYWAFWDEVSKDYVTSEYRAEGGAIMPLFWVDPETLMLYVTYQNGYEGAKFKLENGILYSVKTIEDGRSN